MLGFSWVGEELMEPTQPDYPDIQMSDEDIWAFDRRHQVKTYQSDWTAEQKDLYDRATEDPWAIKTHDQAVFVLRQLSIAITRTEAAIELFKIGGDLSSLSKRGSWIQRATFALAKMRDKKSAVFARNGEIMRHNNAAFTERDWRGRFVDIARERLAPEIFNSIMEEASRRQEMQGGGGGALGNAALRPDVHPHCRA